MGREVITSLVASSSTCLESFTFRVNEIGSLLKIGMVVPRTRNACTSFCCFDLLGYGRSLPSCSLRRRLSSAPILHKTFDARAGSQRRNIEDDYAVIREKYGASTSLHNDTPRKSYEAKRHLETQ